MFTYGVIVRKTKDMDGDDCYQAEAPDFRECIVSDETFDEALRIIKMLQDLS